MAYGYMVQLDSHIAPSFNLYYDHHIGCDMIGENDIGRMKIDNRSEEFYTFGWSRGEHLTKAAVIGKTAVGSPIKGDGGD